MELVTVRSFIMASVLVEQLSARGGDGRVSQSGRSASPLGLNRIISPPSRPAPPHALFNQRTGTLLNVPTPLAICTLFGVGTLSAVCTLSPVCSTELHAHSELHVLSQLYVPCWVYLHSPLYGRCAGRIWTVIWTYLVNHLCT